MQTIDDRLHGLSTTPAPAPPALDDLRLRARARRRHRALTAAAGGCAVAVAVAGLAWSTLAGTDSTPDVVAGPTADEATGDPCEGTTLTSLPDPQDTNIPLDDPVKLACQALQYYGNTEPPAAVRLGPVDTETFQTWQRQHTGGIGPLNSAALPDTVIVLVVRASDGGLWAPRTPAGSSGQLRGDTLYIVFTEGVSPEDLDRSGTSTWSEILASPWARELEQIEVG